MGLRGTHRRHTDRAVAGLAALAVAIGLSSSCGGNVIVQASSDAGSQDGTTICGAAGQACCNGAACDNGLTCAGGTCSVVSCGGLGEPCCNGTACNTGLMCNGVICTTDSPATLDATVDSPTEVGPPLDAGIPMDAPPDVAPDVDGGPDAVALCDGGQCVCGDAVSFSAFGDDVYLNGVNAVPSTGFTWDYWFNATMLPTSSAVNISAGATQLIAADYVVCEDIHVGFGTEFSPANQIGFNVDGLGQCAARDTSPIYYSPPGGFVTGKWYFVAVSHDYGTGASALYLDGALVASKTAAVLPITRVLPVTVGRWTDRSAVQYNEFYGAIDEVHIYGRVLSAAEVSDEYGAGAGRHGSPTDVGLVAGYHFDDGSGTAAGNYAVGGAAGTLENTASWAPGFVCSSGSSSGDGGSQDGSTTCGGSGEPCCNGTVCDSGLACAGGACATGVTFSYTGTAQSFSVPAGVTQVTIAASGAAGGAGLCGGAAGEGATTTAAIAVTPGETLAVFVGGQGSASPCGCGCPTAGSGGFNGGAQAGGSASGGGGASDVRQAGSALANRVVVAGGGGGGDSGGGGAGGTTTGITGSAAGGGTANEGGGGGTQTGGGAGASSSEPGTPGTLGTGGAGSVGGGGGGGGGYYGGGGGGCGFGCGGGGGGSSYAEPTATNVSMSAGAWTGNGQVVITW